MKTLYIECNMGVAGDMLMGALYELCEQKEKFLSDMNQAFTPYGVTLSAEPAVKCGISGTHMRVAVHGEEEHSHDVLPEHIHAKSFSLPFATASLSTKLLNTRALGSERE